jgi:glycosyltransferase involved in cell wall biosynthesis
MPEPIVSVVIPAYNRSALLGEAIESVLAQDHPRLEVIVVDDGSTDDTPSVVRSYGNRVKYIRQEHSGRSAARNRGLAHAAGEFVAFLDSDDVFLPGKLSTQVLFLLDHPEVDAVYGDGHTLDAQGRLGPLQPYVTPLPDATSEVIIGHLLSHNLFALHTALVRRRALPDEQKFDESLDALEDWDLWIRIALAGREIRYHDSKVAAYRRHGANTDIVDPAALRSARVAICTKIVKCGMDACLSTRLRQQFRLEHLSMILWSRSTGVILSALRTIVFPNGRLSPYGLRALTIRLVVLPVRAARIGGRSLAGRLGWAV